VSRSGGGHWTVTSDLRSSVRSSAVLALRSDTKVVTFTDTHLPLFIKQYIYILLSAKGGDALKLER